MSCIIASNSSGSSVYLTLAAASEGTGVGVQSVSQCTNGVRQRSKGWSFKRKLDYQLVGTEIDQYLKLLDTN